MHRLGARGQFRLVGGQGQIEDVDEASAVVDAEGRQVDALVQSHDGLDQARLKLGILAERLRADGHVSGNRQ